MRRRQSSGAGYRGTLLWRDHANSRRYVTVDTWDSLDAYLAMKAQLADNYDELDRKCADLTESENHLGVFETV